MQNGTMHYSQHVENALRVGYASINNSRHITPTYRRVLFASTKLNRYVIGIVCFVATSVRHITQTLHTQ